MTLEERFWSKVDKPGDCWNWTAYTAGNGYGSLFFGTKKNPKPRSAHVVSYEIHNGPIPAGMNVLHTCDNRRCVNPDHLFLGTQSDNLIDALKKGRAPGMKLCEADVELILSLGDKTLKEIADWFDISISQVWNIRNKKQWKYISEKPLAA